MHNHKHLWGDDVLCQTINLLHSYSKAICRKGELLYTVLLTVGMSKLWKH